jgi:hydroxymethylpyrimidine/phosphomethylpyrimidine kinase
VQNQTSPLVLTFGLTDPVGAIGIQADLASFAGMGCHGLSVITAISIADTTGTEDVQPIDADWVADQARLMLEDMPIAAFKVGYTGGVETIAVIAEIVSDYPEVPLVLDPFSTSLADTDVDEEILIALRELLIPQTTILLLSLDELAKLAETWREPSDEAMLEIDVMHLIQLGCEFVMVTGTPAEKQDVTNTLFNSDGIIRTDSRSRLAGTFVGAGNTISAGIAAMLANGITVPEAVVEAEEYTAAALSHAQRLGMGKLIPDRFFWARESDLKTDIL